MAGLLVTVCLGRAAWATDRIDDLAHTLESSTDEKARLAAVVSLGRLADPRGVPALSRALSDRSAVVRGVAATALGHIGDVKAIPALERALIDDDAKVRERVREALASLRASKDRDHGDDEEEKTERITPKERPRLGNGKTVHVTVKTMASRAPRTSKEMAKQMQGFVVAELEKAPEVTIDADEKSSSGFVIDGSITKFARAENGPWVEVTCEVKLAVSTADGRIVSMVTGAATVQMPRSHFKASMEKGLATDALENAVRGAHQNMIAFLGRQIAAK